MYIKEEFGIFVIVIALFTFQILLGFDKFYNHYYCIHRHLINIVYLNYNNTSILQLFSSWKFFPGKFAPQKLSS